MKLNVKMLISSVVLAIVLVLAMYIGYNLHGTNFAKHMHGNVLYLLIIAVGIVVAYVLHGLKRPRWLATVGHLAIGTVATLIAVFLLSTKSWETLGYLTLGIGAYALAWIAVYWEKLLDRA